MAVISKLLPCTHYLSKNCYVVLVWFRENCGDLESLWICRRCLDDGNLECTQNVIDKYLVLTIYFVLFVPSFILSLVTVQNLEKL